MIHNQMDEEATKSYCGIPLEDLVTVFVPTLQGTMFVVHSDTDGPLDGQDFCQVCEDASPPPEEGTGEPA